MGLRSRKGTDQIVGLPKNKQEADARQSEQQALLHQRGVIGSTRYVRDSRTTLMAAHKNGNRKPSRKGLVLPAPQCFDMRTPQVERIAPDDGIFAHVC